MQSPQSDIVREALAVFSTAVQCNQYQLMLWYELIFLLDLFVCHLIKCFGG